MHLDASGRKRWLMQADEMLYQHPDRVRLLGSAIDVDADALSDVVLEVDRIMDVRRGDGYCEEPSSRVLRNGGGSGHAASPSLPISFL